MGGCRSCLVLGLCDSCFPTVPSCRMTPGPLRPAHRPSHSALRWPRFRRSLPVAVYGTDYEGKVCGWDRPDARYVTYPRVNEDFLANLGKKNPLDYKFYGVCVEACPGYLDVVCNYVTAMEDPAYTSDVKRECIVDSSYSPPAPVDCGLVQDNCWITPQDTSSIMFRCIPVYNVTNAASSVCTYPPDVTSPMDPRCITVTDNKQGTVQRPAKPNLLFDQLNTARQVWGRWFGDLARSWWVILLCAVGLALLLAFTWTLFLKYCTTCMVWTTLLVLVLGLSFLTGFFYYKAGLVTFEIPPSLTEKLNSIPSGWTTTVADATRKAAYMVPEEWRQNSEQYKTSYSAMAYISTAVLFIVVAMIAALRQSIRIAIEVLKLGTDALRGLPSIIFFPCTNVVTVSFFLVWWVFVAACLQSAGQITTTDLGNEVASGLATLQAEYGSQANFTAAVTGLLDLPSVNATIASVQDMPVMNYLIIYHIFGLLWTTQFIQGVANMTIAGAVCAWYFSRLAKPFEGKEEYEKFRYPKGRFPVCASLGRTLRRYTGSIAFGSLLIALVQFARLVMAYVQRRLSDQAKNNQTLKWALCCIQCCLKCLQSIVEVVTRNALIYIALKDRSFCGAGADVFRLIVNHGRVFMVVNALGEVLMFLGKITISTLCAWGAYVLLDNLPEFRYGGKHELSSTWLPILVTLFFSYAIASGFFMVFDLACDSVLVCYVTGE